MSSNDTLVWYAAYGSNLDAERFACYLHGGSPKGSKGTNPGSRDPRPPRAESPIIVPGRLYFAGHSSVWGGSRAFVQPNGNGGQAYARGYLISVAQFIDVLRQENGDDPRNPRLTVSVEEVLEEPGRFVPAVHPDRGEAAAPYTRVLNLGAIDGHSVFTFTAGSDDYASHLAPPSPAYLTIIIKGIHATFPRLDQTTIADYLHGCDGVCGFLPLGEVHRLVDAAIR